jgi:Zn-dependent peptidase ImmA (M78 family)
LGLAYDPWAHAARLDIPIINSKLPRGWRGAYRHEDRVIVLVRGMSNRELRSTLAHEVQHAIAGDIRTLFGFINHRQERLASLRAAVLLVDPDEYSTAEQLREGHLISIAHDLNVTLKVVTDWLNWRESNAGDFRPRELMP